jgi:hypothetical protein
MRICLGLKGAFSINDIRKGLDDTPSYHEKLNKSMADLKEKIIKPFEDQGHTFDIICSTYDTKFVNVFQNNFPVKQWYKFPTSCIEEGGDWTRQLLHYMKLMEMILEMEKKEDKYDLIIFTRFDLLFYKKVTEWDLNLNEFNIAVKHSSGNCDDNIWIFHRNYLQAFCNSIQSLLVSRGITHALNHRLVEQGVPVHYMYEITEEDYKNDTTYKLFVLNRN